MRIGSAYSMSVRVYYEDTDFSGVVYHASYLRFLERGRTETLRDLGVHQADLHGEGRAGALAFVVRRMAIEWIKPARMDDLLVIETSIDEVHGASMRLKQAVFRSETLLLTADVVVALVANGRPARMPFELKSRLMTKT